MIAHSSIVLFALTIAVLCVQAQPADIRRNDIYTEGTLMSLSSGKHIESVKQKIDDLEQSFDRKTATYLKKLERQEARIYKKLWEKDSSLAKQLLGNIKERYGSLQADASMQAQQLSRFSQVYSGKLDSLNSAFRFLEKSEFISPGMKSILPAAMQSISRLQLKVNQTDQIKKYLKERKQLLAVQSEKFGLTRYIRQYNKQYYYYQQQIQDYKQLLETPGLFGKKLLGVLAEHAAFRNFFAKNSQLASLFNLPGSLSNDPASLAGLQTRAAVMQDLQNRFGASPAVQQALQQNMQAAQEQLSQLKSKINEHLPQGGGSDEEMPDFKPNAQKTKSFWQRLEYSTNFQSQRSNNYFPVTSDIGLSLGYKLNDKSVMGIGTSYKIGWGQNIRNIRVTHQGVGLRSFADVKLKGSFWISGGFEANYRNEFNRVDALRAFNAWQQSGLIGVSKIVSMNNRFFKKTKLQLLWDFLSYQQVPRTQALVFRVGYNIK